MNLDIVVLAGGRCDPDLRAASGAEFRADVRIGAQTLLESTQAALAPLGNLIVVGGSLPESIPAGDTFMASLRTGLERAEAPQVLLATADMPDLKTTSVWRFLELCENRAALNYPIVPAELCAERYPGMKRTTLRLREGTFTGGNLALIDRSSMGRWLPMLEQAYAARKKPLTLAGMVGTGTLARVLASKVFPGLLGIADLERAVGRMLKAEVHGVRVELPEIGADLDSVEQYHAFRERADRRDAAS